MHLTGPSHHRHILYYARVVNPSILVALNKIASQQAAPTELTAQACDHFLNYLAMHPLSVIRYKASNMMMHMVLDMAYLVLPNACSRAATLFTLTDHLILNFPNHKPNGTLHVMLCTICSVPASASEAETGGIFLGGQEACPIITSLTKLGHLQPPRGTSIGTTIFTVHNILTSQVRMKRSKAFDMNYHWIKECIDQNQFQLYWAKGLFNWADYFSKHFPHAHHQK